MQVVMYSACQSVIVVIVIIVFVKKNCHISRCRDLSEYPLLQKYQQRYKNGMNLEV